MMEEVTECAEITTIVHEHWAKKYGILTSSGSLCRQLLEAGYSDMHFAEMGCCIYPNHGLS
ncbi:hypothetical protein DPMN_137096 [Dreissena polymorpha]|uniref:Uncharacterized protein n=1 Tax=Dreissena polymorpha TaxID=45954 RepID=A0A9D4G4W4_DREPO|nr:hypothetical protein DPMN_137096 [Dreissena polymorpha]